MRGQSLQGTVPYIALVFVRKSNGEAAASPWSEFAGEEGAVGYEAPFCRYACIATAERLPAPMASITVAAPVTMSPPA